MKELWRGLLPQLQVIYALVLRETRTRFGKNHLGYLWALFEPLLWIGGFMLSMHLARTTPPNGMTAVGFLATGVVPGLMFRNAVSRSENAVSSNKGLLFYPQVRPLDLTVARVSLEIATIAVVFVLIMLGEALYLGRLEIDHFLQLLVGLGLAAGLGASLGLVISALVVFVPSIEHVSGVLLRGLWWFSGIFYTANNLPSHVREWVLYNPLFHAIEIVRDGWFYEYTSDHASLTYPLAWILLFSFLGLTLERVARRRLEIA